MHEHDRNNNVEFMFTLGIFVFCKEIAVFVSRCQILSCNLNLFIDTPCVTVVSSKTMKILINLLLMCEFISSHHTACLLETVKQYRNAQFPEWSCMWLKNSILKLIILPVHD